MWNFTVHNVSTPHKHGIPKFKENHPRLIPGPTERNHGA